MDLLLLVSVNRTPDLYWANGLIHFVHMATHVSGHQGVKPESENDV
jgi:hypothetical protein